MTTTNDGGPAFPSYSAYEGMSLRDYFAAKAMQTLLSSEYTSEHGLHEGWMLSLARESYQVADTMLAARGVK